MKIKPLRISLEISIILISLLGIFSENYYSFGEQFWFFTVQTNIFVVIFESILLITNLFPKGSKASNLTAKKWFNFLHLQVVYLITITGFVYCFILAPAAMLKNGNLLRFFSIRAILLHIFIPALTLIEYFTFSPKDQFTFKHTPLFLIYPLIYFIMVNLRVLFGGSPFTDGSYYPYFFLDPNLNNLGWGSVAIFISIALVMFWSLACLFIWINKKSANKKAHK